MAALARRPAYVQTGDTDYYPRACAHAMDFVYPLDRVPIVGVNLTILADVDAMLGEQNERLRRRAYIAYLIALKAAGDGFSTLLSATGSQSVLCCSHRFSAAFDDLATDDWCGVRCGACATR